MFVVFEGIDGSGKTTAMAEVAKRLGGTVHCTKEPYMEIDQDLLTTDTQRTLAYLFDRSIHAPVLEDAIKYYDYVLCDRYHGSTIAYQGNSMFTRVTGYFPKPDCVLWFDVPLDVAKRRRRARGDTAPADNLELVAQRYKDLCQTETTWDRVDASQKLDAVVNDCLALIRNRQY